MPRISVVIPSYNEARTIRDVASAFEVYDDVAEVIVVDGRSDDGSYELLVELSKQLPKIKVLQEPARKGKGNAVAFGVRAAECEIVVIQDADNEIPASDVVEIARSVNEKAPVVFGSRFLDRTQECAYPSMTYANKLFTRLFNLRHRTELTDVLTACKAARAELWKAIELDAKGYEIEIEVAEQFAGRVGIAERPVVYRPRKNEDGKKIRLKHALVILRRIFRRK